MSTTEPYRVYSVIHSVEDTPEMYYWAENFRALVEDDGRWFPQESVTAEHRRALDRALLLGVPDGDV